MDKGHQKQDLPEGFCDKIRRTLSLIPAMQSVRRVSYLQQETKSSASTASAMPSSKNVPENKRGNRVVIPIEFDRSAFAREKQKHRHIPIEEKTKANLWPSQGHGEFILRKDSDSDNTSMNERFSDFINRAKQQIGRTSSDIGVGGVKRLDSVNKKASAYIDRARQRIRRSSTFDTSSFKHKD